MDYDFDQVIDRTGTDSTKWSPDVLEEKFGRRDLLPLWVADMDFKSPPQVIEAIVKRAQHGIYGYSVRPESYYEAIINWTRRRFGWDIEKSWIEYTPGVVPAINYLCQAFCKAGDKILIQEPVYYPFAASIIKSGCQPVNNPLVFNGDQYEIDFEDFKNKVEDPQMKMFILCSPHNPIARVWTKEELKKMGHLCLANDVLIISDEIHNDLVYSAYQHTMLASLSEELAMNTITCTAPSKTFNMAGMQASNIIIPNKKLRRAYQEVLDKNHIGSQNPLSMVAVEAAYNEGEEWLEKLLLYLEENIQFIHDYLAQHLPKAKLIETQATYLGWIDLSYYEQDGKKLEAFLTEQGKVALDGGTWFGQGGEGFVRINFACPRSLLEEALEKICTLS